MIRQRWFRGLMIVVVLLAGLVGSGMVYQTTATAQDMAVHPAPGQLVTVDGDTMHIYCEGEGSPTVVFEAGLGGTYLDWALVQPEVAKRTRTCAYDRSGMGYSDFVGAPLDTHATAERLGQLLDAAGIEGPYLLVGHSYGAIHIRSFYHLYPSDVVGMVMVDSSHDNQLQRVPEGALDLPWLVEAIFNAGPSLSRVGLLRVLGLAEQNAAPHLTPDQAANFVAIYNRVDFWQGRRVETQMSLIETNQQTPPAALGDLPLVVIMQDVELEENLPEEIANLWPGLQAELAALSTNSTLIVADGASHYVHYDRPQIVIDAVLGLLD